MRRRTWLLVVSALVLGLVGVLVGDYLYRIGPQYPATEGTPFTIAFWDDGCPIVPEAVRTALVARGHKLRVGGPWTMGSLAAIVVDSKTGVLSAGTNPRVDAYAIAW